MPHAATDTESRADTTLSVTPPWWWSEPARPVAVARRPDAWVWAVLAVCVGAFMGQLDASIITVALPDVGRDFNVGLTGASWVALVYLLVLVSLVVPMGRWADCRGRKLLYLHGFFLFTIASAACALAPNLPLLLASRAVQAVGAALLQANSVGLVVDAAPPGRRGRALAAQGAAQALGLALGPTVGGVLLSLASWRTIFLVNVPAGAVGLALGWFLLPRSRDLRAAEPVPWPSLLLFVAAVASALLALSSDGARSVGCLMTSACAASAFVLVDRRTASSLFDGLFRIRLFRAGAVSGVLGYAVLFGLLLAVPLALSGSASPAVTGLVLSGLPVCMGLGALLAGGAIDRYGPTRVSVVGMSLLAPSLVTVVLTSSTDVLALPVLAALLMVAGTGFGLWLPANNTAAMGATLNTRAGLAGGTLNMSRGIGTGLGIAVTAQVGTSVAPAQVLEVVGVILLALLMLAFALGPSDAVPSS